MIGSSSTKSKLIGPGEEWIPNEAANIFGDKRSKFGRTREEENGKKPLAIYRPYSSRSDTWGIYFMQRSIEEDFRALSDILSKNHLFLQEDIYIAAIFLHELTHHVIEDVLILNEGRFDHKEDKHKHEGLCEYVAFRLLELSPRIGFDFLKRPAVFCEVKAREDYEKCKEYKRSERKSKDKRHSYRFEWPIIEHFVFPRISRTVSALRQIGETGREKYKRRKFEELDLHFALSLLYYWWSNDDESSAYHPKVYEDFWSRIESNFEEVLQQHLVPYQDIRIRQSVRMPRQSIYERIYEKDP